MANLGAAVHQDGPGGGVEDDADADGGAGMQVKRAIARTRRVRRKHTALGGRPRTGYLLHVSSHGGTEHVGVQEMPRAAPRRQRARKVLHVTRQRGLPGVNRGHERRQRRARKPRSDHGAVRRHKCLARCQPIERLAHGARTGMDTAVDAERRGARGHGLRAVALGEERRAAGCRRHPHRGAEGRRALDGRQAARALLEGDAQVGERAEAALAVVEEEDRGDLVHGGSLARGQSPARSTRAVPEKRGPAVANAHAVSVRCSAHAGTTATSAERNASTMSEPMAAAPLPPPQSGVGSA